MAVSIHCMSIARPNGELNIYIWTKNTKCWTNFFYIFLWKTCLTVDLQSSVTFWLGKISSFRKSDYSVIKVLSCEPNIQKLPRFPSRLKVPVKGQKDFGSNLYFTIDEAA